MAVPEGYEELPGGTEPLLPQHGPTLTPAAAGDAQQQQAALQRQPHPQLEQLPPFPQYLAGLPSVEQEWERATLLFSVWLGCSAGTLALALLTLNALASAGAACGVLGAATHRFAALRNGRTLADCVHRILRLAIAAACLAGVVAGTCILVAIGLSAACGSTDDKKGCAAMAEVTTFFAVWYCLYTAVTAGAVRSAARMRRLLNPVSSGAVAI